MSDEKVPDDITQLPCAAVKRFCEFFKINIILPVRCFTNQSRNQHFCFGFDIFFPLFLFLFCFFLFFAFLLAQS